MQVDELFTYFGKPSDTARALGTSRQNVYAWQKAGAVPLKWQFEAELMSYGALKVSHQSRDQTQAELVKAYEEGRALSRQDNYKKGRREALNEVLNAIEDLKYHDTSPEGRLALEGAIEFIEETMNELGQP